MTLPTEVQVCRALHGDARKELVYVPFWPFDAEKCARCFVYTYWGPVKLFVWELLVAWWWHGQMVETGREFPASRRREV